MTNSQAMLFKRGYMNIRNTSLLVPLWFAGVACAVFWRVLLRGEVLYYGDIMLYFHPVLAFEHRWLSRGVLPLWNPHTLFGQPFVGNPQEWLFYPSTLLVAWLGAERAIAWGAIVHLWLAGVGVWLFAGRLGYSPRSAVLAGTLWTLCGAVVLRSQHVGILQTLAWYGWSFWALEGLLQRSNLHSAVVLSAVLAMASLAGSPQMWHMLLLMLLAWVVYRWRALEAKLHVLRWAIIACAVAFLIGGAHWMPLMELLRHTDRTHPPLAELVFFSIYPYHFPLLLAPNLFGFPWQGNYALKVFYWELAFFVGIVPILIVLARWRRAQAQERFWKWAVILSLWLAMGPYGGLYWLAYHLIPGMQSFRTPLRWTAVTDFALCLWAAWALEQVQLDKRWWRLPLALLALAVLWQAFGETFARAVAGGMVSEPNTLSIALQLADNIGSALWRATAMVVLAVALLSVYGGWRWWAAAGVTVAELLWIAIPANPTCSPEVFTATPQISVALREAGQRLFVPDTSPIWLKYVNARDYGPRDEDTLKRFRETLCSNIGMAHGISEASGYEPAALRNSLRKYVELSQHGLKNTELLRHVGVQAIATGNDAEGWKVTLLPRPGARAWMAGTGERVELQMPTPQQVVLIPRGEGTLVLTDSAYPGWRAFVDGKPVRWQVYDGAFRAVAVSAHARRVEWRYAPDTFRVGLFLTCMGLAILTAMAAHALARRSSAD
ncbi:MAG: hypothetical protein HPY54_14480 [Chthonomonadetes bacterium]|nr:hypothetical protein [Chthonomonadetes bacterium]